MTKARRWILGAADPEMVVIEALLRYAGEKFVHATAGGRRVHPGNAYAADPVAGGATHWVECAPRETGQGWHGECAVCGADVANGDVCVCAPAVVIDHHRPGDPGYGRPAAEFMAASSLGQVIGHLARLEIGIGEGMLLPIGEPLAPEVLLPAGSIIDSSGRGAWVVTTLDGWWPLAPAAILVAAADHCLAAAYAGLCPGVDPERLAEWRAVSRAEFQHRALDAVLWDVAAAGHALAAAPRIVLGGVLVADLVGSGDVHELPEAAARAGIAFLASPRPGPDGRVKVVLQAAAGAAVAAFLAGEGPARDLLDRYGDPARGFAGGYRTAPRS